MREPSKECELLFDISKGNFSIASLEGINESYLFTLAQANGLIPLVDKALEASRTRTPEDSFKETALQIKRTNFFMSAQLLYLIDLLQKQNISLIPLKGPLLSQHAYKDLSLRPFSDLDILVFEKDLPKVAHTLLKLGYESEHSLEALSHPYVLQKSSDISFVHPQSQVIIELHWKLLKSASHSLSDINALFQHSIKHNFQNTQLASLPLEEEFLYLCVHGAKHRFERIEWMNDINQLFILYKNTFNWDKLFFLAKEESYQTPYALALKILQQRYQQNIPHKKSQALMRSKTVLSLYKKVFILHANDYILKPKKEGFRWMEFYFSFQLEDTLRRKIILLRSLFFPLYIDDILRIKPLPKHLSFLYYLARFKRLLKL